MGLSVGLKAVFDNLVFAIDAKNPKVYTDIPGITDHGISDWYCFLNGTAIYSAIYPNTQIIQIDQNGVETVLVTTGNDPQRGSISIIAGNRYYGTKAIHLLYEGVQDAIAPVSFAGTYFGNNHARHDPQTINIYAPQDDITVNVYQSYNYSGGVTGTPVSTINISKGVSDTYTFYGAYRIVLSTGGTGDYQVEETVEYEHTRANGTTFTATAEVVSWDNSNRILIVTNISGDGYGDGNITSGTSIVGQTSNATWNFSSRTYEPNIFLSTDKPAIMTVGGNGGDNHIMQPMTNYVYRRRNQIELTINDTAPSNLSNSYVAYDASLPVFALEYGDGAGSDSTQGIGYEYLSDTFSWGNVLSDYQIVAPYADTTVTVSYWANSQWNVGEVHSLSGTQTNPDAAFREGGTGFGSPGNTALYSGQAANLASNANLWKWESTKPIALIINDSADDEENMLGWMSNKYLRTSSNVTQSFVNLINKDDRSRMKIYGKDLTTTIEYAGAKLSAGDYFEFDGSNDYSLISLNNPSGDWIHSIEFWMNMNQNQSAISARQDPFQIGTPSTSRYSAVDISNNNFNWYFYSNDCRVTTNLFVANTWYHIGLTYTGGGATSTNKQLYVNGVNVSFNTSGSANLNIPANSTLSIGRDHGRTTAHFNGKIANFKIYNRALTASEIKQNFNATRSRFGI